MLRAVVLVLKFADDLLDGVLDGDQSGDAAVFVDDNRHMLPGLLHGVEQVIHRLRLGNQHRLPDDGGDIALRGGGIERRGAHGVLEIRHADQIVDVVADHRHAGETGPGAQTQHVGKCGRAVHADHVGARHHDLAGQRLRQRQHVAQHLGDFRIEIIGLHQAVDGGTPLFELNLLQLLVVGQVRFLGATLLTLLLARLRKRRDRGGEPDQSRQIEHDVDRLAGSRGPRADQHRYNADDQREQEAAQQLQPDRRIKQRRHARHQHAVEHVACDAEERAAARGGVPVGDEPLHGMDLADFLHPDELARLGVGLHFEDLVVQSCPCDAPDRTFRGGHAQRQPDQQCGDDDQRDNQDNRGRIGQRHRNPSFEFMCSAPVTALPPNGDGKRRVIPLSAVRRRATRRIRQARRPRPSAVWPVRW